MQQGRWALRVVLLVALLAALVVGGRGTVSAEHHPFCGSGQEFAHEHIVGLAQAGTIGPPQSGGLHNPGAEHQGFFTCLHR